MSLSIEVFEGIRGGFGSGLFGFTLPFQTSFNSGTNPEFNVDKPGRRWVRRGDLK